MLFAIHYWVSTKKRSKLWVTQLLFQCGKPTSEELPLSLKHQLTTLLNLHSPYSWKAKGKVGWTPKILQKWEVADNSKYLTCRMENVQFCVYFIAPLNQSTGNSDNKPLSSSSRTVRKMKELVTLETTTVLQGLCLCVMEQYDSTLMTSSSDDLHSTDSRRSVTVPSSSTEITLTGTATVFPVRIAVFRISAS